MDHLSTRHSPTRIEEIIAGFIVWLAYQKPGKERRHRSPALAEQFLRWQQRQRERQQPAGLNDYLAQLSHDAATAIHVSQVEQAVQLLERYLQADG